MAITGRFKSVKVRKRKKALPILFSILGVILLLGAIGYVVASKTELDSYVINTRLDATSAHPPELSGIVNEGVVKETALVSIMPSLNLKGLSLLSSGEHTTMTGTISINCGSTYQETRNFELSTSIPGDSMKQKFIWKGVPADLVCSITAQASTCETVQPYCIKNKVSQIIVIPEI